MRFLHYSAEPFQFDADRKYEQGEHWKPRGLWLSVEGEQDWKEWCESERFGSLNHVTEVTLKPGSNVLTIATTDALDRFNRDFGNGDDLSVRSIDWQRVRTLWDGLIIAPYQWERRLDLMWYYGWDCASGVIWNLGAIAEVKSLATATA